MTNQRYWVVQGDGYQNLDKKPLPQWHRAEKDRQLVLQSLPQVPHSESEALEIASSCGLLEAFLGEDVLLKRRKQFGYWFSRQKRLRVQVDGGIAKTTRSPIQNGGPRRDVGEVEVDPFGGAPGASNPSPYPPQRRGMHWRRETVTAQSEGLNGRPSRRHTVPPVLGLDGKRVSRKVFKATTTRTA